MTTEAIDTLALVGELRRDVCTLATDIGERHVWLPDKLAAARDFVEASLAGFDYRVNRQAYDVDGVEVCNLIAELPGTASPERVLIIGAHYDSRCAMDRIRRARRRLPNEPGTPGANDNATGIAATLALARRFAGRPLPCTVRFVGFVNEEPPFFMTEKMGSWVYAKSCRARGDNIIGMLTPETLGYYTDEPKSQRYPFPYNLVHPSTGNFIAFLSNRASRALLRRAGEAFRKHSTFPLVTQAMPTPTRHIGWSDDWAFWQEGYPAMAITDTAFLRYRYYHTVDDTPDKLDFDRMAKVVAGLVGVVGELGRMEDG